MSEPLVYTAADLQRELKVGRATAQRLARELGVRVSPRRVVVPLARLMAYLEGGDTSNGGRTAPGGQDAAPADGRSGV
jgi:hypothetical protein